MIAVVIREMTYLKVLTPIILEFIQKNIPYAFYYMDSNKGDKEYLRPTLERLKKNNSILIDKSRVLRSFSNDEQLKKQLVRDKITKLVSLEIWLWAKSYINFLKKHNIKTYSVLYLTDSLWQKSPNSVVDIDRIYYSSLYLRDLYLNFVNVPFNPERDRCLGFPGLDSISGKCGDDILVLSPNLKQEHVKSAFGTKERFIKIIEKIHSTNPNLIFKSRVKQWLPKEIESMAKEIVYDGDIMYPPKIANLFERTFCTIMFYSSGIYESVYASNFITNIELPLNRWSWNQLKMKKYFSDQPGSLYNWSGVVESFSQEGFLRSNWTPKYMDLIEKESWLDKFVGKNRLHISKNIAKDIVA